MTDFTDLLSVSELITARFGSLPVDAENMLEASACKNEDGTINAYRPYIVIAALIDSDVDLYKRLRSAAGSEIEFKSRSAYVRNMAALQAKFDAGLEDCTIADVWKADDYLEPRLVF